MELKETNPKDAIGVRKAGMHCVPCQPLFELGLAMMEGARKYGSHNYRVSGVRGSVYYDAALRHLASWWEGEDIDPDSGLPHLVKAMACLVVIRDAVINTNWVDDRPPSLANGWLTDLNKKAGDLIDRLPDSKEPYVKKPSFPEDFQMGEMLLEPSIIDWEAWQRSRYGTTIATTSSLPSGQPAVLISPADLLTTGHQPSPSAHSHSHTVSDQGYTAPISTSSHEKQEELALTNSADRFQVQRYS